MAIELDQFNSKIFHMRMGNIFLNKNESIEDVVNKNANNFDHLSIKVSTTNKDLTNKCLKNGFILADTLVSFTFDLKKNQLPLINHKCLIRTFKNDDLDGVMHIAKNSFKIDRFHSDPSLNNELCDKYYEQWIYNSCHGFADQVIIAEYDNEVVGFTTGKFYQQENSIHLVLSAVSTKYRGLGIYTSMIYEGIKWARQFDCEKLYVGTQIDNIAVQKAWIKLGFTVFNSEYVLQKKL